MASVLCIDQWNWCVNIKLQTVPQTCAFFNDRTNKFTNRISMFTFHLFTLVWCVLSRICSFWLTAKGLCCTLSFSLCACVTTKTGRLLIQRQVWQMTLASNVSDTGHVSLFVKSKRWTHMVTFLSPKLWNKLIWNSKAICNIGMSSWEESWCRFSAFHDDGV